MQKELLTVEFRYHDRPDSCGFGEHPIKKITIGVFDTLKEAVEKGNEVLKTLSEKGFEIRSDDRFKVKGLFGLPERLVSNCCYPTKGIQYFAKITPLKFDDLDSMIQETFDAYERYKFYKTEE